VVLFYINLTNEQYTTKCKIACVKPVFHFNRIVTYRSIFFCVEVISSTLVVRKQRNTLATLRYDTVEVENRLKGNLK
jgi:hypothetical protein